MNFLGHEIVLLDFNYTISLINNLCVFIQMNGNKDQNIFFDDIVRTHAVRADSLNTYLLHCGRKTFSRKSVLVCCTTF